LGSPRSDEALEQRLGELRTALAAGAELPAELLVNDLEPAALSLCPETGAALAAVRRAGASHAFVCGSGPTVAGLYTGAGAADLAAAGAARLVGQWRHVTTGIPVDPGFGEPVVDSVRHNLRVDPDPEP
jgi:4-diphosphocytidyl-2-C-methyl-D-erythritol kinase